MRVMGLDYGSKTVGVALSDPLGLTAQGIETIWRRDENKLRKTCARIEELIREYEVERIVLGLPRHMNSDVGDRAEKSLEFGEMLRRRTGLETSTRPLWIWGPRCASPTGGRTVKAGIARKDARKSAWRI